MTTRRCGSRAYGRWLPGRLLVLGALLCVPPASPGQTPAPCNPVVHLNVENASLSKTLRELSKTQDFALVFPDSVDRPVTLDADLPLDRLLKRLTNGLSTSWIYADYPACSGDRIKQLVVYPVGQDTPLPRVHGWREGNGRQPVPDQGYIYVEDMEQYVREVLNHQHRADLAHLTPEQRADFRRVRKLLHKELGPKSKKSRKRPARSPERKDAAPDQAATAPAE
jgi:hypothetical protein